VPILCRTSPASPGARTDDVHCVRAHACATHSISQTGTVLSVLISRAGGRRSSSPLGRGTRRWWSCCSRTVPARARRPNPLLHERPNPPIIALSRPPAPSVLCHSRRLRLFGRRTARLVDRAVESCEPSLACGGRTAEQRAVPRESADRLHRDDAFDAFPERRPYRRTESAFRTSHARWHSLERQHFAEF
jgi:hypothetical protein